MPLLGAGVAAGAESDGRAVAGGLAGVVTEEPPSAAPLAEPAVPHGATVVAPHDAVNTFLMRPNSLWSMLSFQWDLMATHSAKYVQRY
jgi:hypothetical protein